LQSPSAKIFVGGDSGYDSHYADIGKRHGPIDLAILENGQYNKAWPYIHHQPEEVMQAAQDLNARGLLPVHSSKFSLALHAWDEPLVRISDLSRSHQISLLSPMIGQVVNLNNPGQTFTPWWEGVE
jgi:L-ascorbate metabolism protein UlaG (beta-lactamase superfamily)